MIAYIDSSVLLRLLFGEPDPLAEWGEIEQAYTSRILAIEVGRVIDRVRLQGLIDDDDVVLLHTESRRLQRSIETVALSEPILERAAGALPTVVGTLDGIHLVIALHVANSLGQPVVMATHDGQLARASRATGLTVIGA